MRKGGLIVPTNDDYVALVSQNRERLSKHFIVPVPDWEIVGAMFDRVTAYAMAESAGIKVPRHWSPKSDAGYMHPYELGSFVWCESTHDNEALKAARALTRLYRCTGQITVEFRRDSHDHSLYFMKIEPRPVRATSLSTAIGMDIPTALHEVFTGGSPRVAREYPDGVCWLWIGQYLNSMVHNSHNNRRDILNVLQGRRNIKAFGEDLTDPIDVFWLAGRLAILIGGKLRRRFSQGLLRYHPKQNRVVPTS